QLSTRRRTSASSNARVLLIGPYDPNRGEYTFCAPPLGVWRLTGVLRRAGIDAHVFDPNCADTPEQALAELLASDVWNVVGISTTGMTLPYDLALAHLAKRVSPRICLVAGGMEATFAPETLLALAPFDLVVLGEGEEPLREIIGRVGHGQALE